MRATLPDVCKTPSKGGYPLPYPNIAFSEDLKEGTETVFADGGFSCAIKGSEFYRSFGDEPGAGGGIKSEVHLDKATWLSWSSDVFLEGKAACRLTDKMLMNKGNTASLGGLNQANLTVEQIKEKLCDYACECRDAAAFQRCVAGEIKRNTTTDHIPSLTARFGARCR